MHGSNVARTIPRHQRGFSYAVVLALIVVMGILAEAANILSSRIIRADREAELLYRGQAYRRAVESYHKANGAYPRSLEDLVKDSRSPATRRHMRELYPDPMASSRSTAQDKGAKQDWVVVRASDGGIGGVSSNSKEEPMKKANFPAGLERFEAAKSYVDWVFEHVPAAALTGSAVQTTAIPDSTNNPSP